MDFQPIPAAYTSQRRSTAEDGLARFFAATHLWMSAGLALTGLVAWMVASTGLGRAILTNQLAFFGLFAAEIGLVFYFSRGVARFAPAKAAGIFLAYAALNGATLSTLFLVYAHATLASAFFVTAGSFAALSVYGAVTRRDLGPVGSFMMTGFWGLLIASVVNIFLQSPAIEWICTCVGVLVFAGLTAYDNQRLRNMYLLTGGAGNLAINGALMLYLDFINMFLFILRAFNSERR